MLNHLYEYKLNIPYHKHNKIEKQQYQISVHWQSSSSQHPKTPSIVKALVGSLLQTGVILSIINSKLQFLLQ